MIEDTLPPPSLETVLRFDYHGDENHAGFNTDLDDSAVSTFSLLYAQRYKTFNLITSLAHFNMAHVVADSTADLPSSLWFSARITRRSQPFATSSPAITSARPFSSSATTPPPKNGWSASTPTHR